MANLFKKAICFTDIHFGLKSNSLQHNIDCLDFVDWIIEKAKAEGCDTGIFLGDWHHQRAAINLLTLHHSLDALQRLSKAFSQFFFIVGNHDLYYRDRRDVHSVSWASHIPNITIVDDWLIEGDTAIIPWMVGDDAKRIKKMNSKYIFGHFELPTFYMNAMIQMPDHGDIHKEDFAGIERVFSGHFHKRQHQKNISYIGNCFAHNFADVDDTDRGCMILEWGKEPKYYAWEAQPLYNVYNLSEVLDNHDKLLKERQHVRVRLDIDISYEEANVIKETFVEQYKLREMALMPIQRTDHELDLAPGEVKFESVDQIVTDQITKIESDHYDPKLLLDIYRSL
jgi:DNA repair exonuclease SbcCD nuclease subunit